MGIQTNIVQKNGNPPISYNILQGESNEYPKNILLDANYVHDIRVNLQTSIDKVDSKTGIVDVVANKQRLDNYNTTSLKDGDLIKVMIDESRGDITAYYKWVYDRQQFECVGEINPYYTKSETDVLLSAINTRIDNYTKVDELRETILFNQ